MLLRFLRRLYHFFLQFKCLMKMTAAGYASAIGESENQVAVNCEQRQLQTVENARVR